jgi:amino acid adenylation domain-containing protein
MSDRTVVTEVWQQVRDAPDRVALIHQAGAVTYGDLWAAASRWAEAIRPHIAGPDPLVGVLRARGPGVPVAHLAAWLAQAAYLPLDPALPPGRLAAILSDSRCQVVLTTSAMADRLPAGVIPVTAPVSAAGSAPPRDNPGDVAYVIYTSGTTGRPKGVEVGHRSLAHLMGWYRAHFTLGPQVRASMLANLMFDGLVLDEWGALSAGSTLAIPAQEVLASPLRTATFLDASGVSHAYLPTPMLERFLAAGARPSALRCIVTGGDRLRIWPDRDFPAAVYNTYGPTESTVLVTASGDLRTAGRRDGLASIGRPVAGAEVWLEGSCGEVITEAGVPGQLVIGGPLLAHGYRHAPASTAAAFPRNADGARTYRTGDFCAWNHHGDIDFLGRSDTQVKVGGYRVELAEIEQIIMREPGIGQAVVLVVGEGPEPRLLAWAEGWANESALRARLYHELPGYMVPEAIEFVVEFPATGSGKVDRSVLLARAKSL